MDGYIEPQKGEGYVLCLACITIKLYNGVQELNPCSSQFGGPLHEQTIVSGLKLLPNIELCSAYYE